MWSHLYGTWLALPKSDNSSQKITLLQVMKVSMIGLLPLSYSFPPVFLLVSPSSYLLISAINCAERNVTHAKSSKSKSKIKFESQSQRQRQRKRVKQNVFQKNQMLLYDLRSWLITEKKSYGLHIFLLVSEPIRHSSSSNIHKLLKVMAIMPLYGHLIL